MLLQYGLDILVSELLASLSKCLFQIFRSDIVRVIDIKMLEKLNKFLLSQHLLDRESGCYEFCIIKLIVPLVIYVLKHFFDLVI